MIPSLLSLYLLAEYAMLTEQSRFGSVIAQVLKSEGGYVNSPHDPGGETNMGISKRAHPEVDIANLTPEQACDIYYASYWRPIRGKDLPLPLALLVMDHAVNAGIDRAARILQKLVGVKQDGVIGSKTVAAAQKAYEQHGTDLIKWYSRDRIAYYAAIDGWKHWGPGWTHRVQEVTILATKWALALSLLEAPSQTRLGADAVARAGG